MINCLLLKHSSQNTKYKILCWESNSSITREKCIICDMFLPFCHKQPKIYRKQIFPAFCTPPAPQKKWMLLIYIQQKWKEMCSYWYVPQVWLVLVFAYVGWSGKMKSDVVNVLCCWLIPHCNMFRCRHTLIKSFFSQEFPASEIRITNSGEALIANKPESWLKDKVCWKNTHIIIVVISSFDSYYLKWLITILEYLLLSSHITDKTWFITLGSFWVWTWLVSRQFWLGSYVMAR